MFLNSKISVLIAMKASYLILTFRFKCIIITLVMRTSCGRVMHRLVSFRLYFRPSVEYRCAADQALHTNGSESSQRMSWARRESSIHLLLGLIACLAQDVVYCYRCCEVCLSVCRSMCVCVLVTA